MEVKYKCDHGWPNQVDSRMRRRVGAYASRSVAFKIGITNDPEKRAGQYKLHVSRLTEMIVLYETTSRENAAALERDLIDYRWEYDDKMAAEKGGGGGRKGEGWYYLYIAREPA